MDAHTRLIASTRTSNLIGTEVNPAPFVGSAQSVDAITYADEVAAAPHTSIAQNELGIDVSVCSAYKFFGPRLGILSASPELLDRLEPERVRPAPEAGPRRWETGMPSLESIAGLHAAIDYLSTVGSKRIRRQERALTQRTLDGLASLDHVRLHGMGAAVGRGPIFAITVSDRSPKQVARELAQYGVFVYSGTTTRSNVYVHWTFRSWKGSSDSALSTTTPSADVDRVIAVLAQLTA